MEKEYVLFKVDGGSYGFPIENVENIEKPAKMTRVPFSETYVKGVINLRGNIIPIIDARVRFGLPVKPVDDMSRIIITVLDEYRIGLLVDESQEVLRLDEDVIEPFADFEVSDDEYVEAIGKHESRLISLLSIKKVLNV